MRAIHTTLFTEMSASSLPAGFMDASHVYEHLSKHRSKEKNGKNGIQHPDGCPAGLLSKSASLRRKTTQARPGTPRGTLRAAGAGGVRGDAPSPNAPVTRPAPSTTQNREESKGSPRRASRRPRSPPRSGSATLMTTPPTTKSSTRLRWRSSITRVITPPLPCQPQPHTPPRLVDLDDGHVDARPYFNAIG